MHTKRLLLFINWFASIASVGYGQSASIAAAERSPNSYLCWQEGRRLAWTDFRAKSFPKSSPFDSLRMAALSAITPVVERTITLAGIHTYTVSYSFLRDSSWVNTRANNTPAKRAATLAHEQVHFDIAELIARRLRQRIAQGLRASEDLHLPRATRDIKRIQAEEDTLDAQFDRESKRAGNHIQEALVLARWQHRITHALLQLAVYQSKPEDCLEGP